MNLLNFIKNSTVVRKYRQKEISDTIIKKIIQAGIWSLSVHGFQPWSFTVIKNKKIINDIADISEKKIIKLLLIVKPILRFSAKIIRNANILILVYNDAEIARYVKRLQNPYIHYAKIVEIQAIGAAIQNMFLEANSLGIGMAWLCSPLFCKIEINNLLQEKRELVALLSLGYPATVLDRRGKRKKYSETVKVIK